MRMSSTGILGVAVLSFFRSESESELEAEEEEGRRGSILTRGNDTGR